MSENEIRTTSNFELREVGEGEDKELRIQGYALTFDSISEDLGFREVIRKGALDDTDMSDVVLNINHDNSKVLARNNKTDGPGSLTLSVDDKGLFFDASPTNTTYAKDLIENMRSGIIGKCSFAFRLDYTDRDAQTWDWAKSEDDFDMRTIHKIKSIHDVSVVTTPAYESTSSTVYQRAKEDMQEENKRQLEKEKLEIELDLI